MCFDDGATTRGEQTMNDDNMIAIYLTPAEADLLLDSLGDIHVSSDEAGQAIDVVWNAIMCAYGG